MESINTINQRLRDEYGLFDDGNPRFRVVWSDDQYEVRFGTYEKVTESGIYLGTEEGFKYVPKYNYLPHQFVLERATGVPEGTKELTTKISYEPMWGFGELREIPWPRIKVIVDVIVEFTYRGKRPAKYTDLGLDSNSLEAKRERVNELRQALFGDDHSIVDALRYREGVVMSDNVKGGKVVESDVTRNIAKDGVN